MGAPDLNPEMRQLQQIFLQESQSLSAALSALVVEMDRDPANRENIDALFRAMHTLKAAASSVPGADAVGEVAHAAEATIAMIRDGTLAWSQSLLPVFLEATDKIVEAINAIANGTEGMVSTDGIVSRLQDLAGSRQGSSQDSAKSLTAPAVNTSEMNPNRPPAGNTGHKEGIYVHPSAIDALRAGLARLIGISNHLQGFTRSEACQRSAGHSELTAIGRMLSQAIDDLSQRISEVRKVPLSRVGARFRRVIAETANQLVKEIHVEVDGDELTVDRELARTLARCLDHIARNACDHGIEPPEVRKNRGKGQVGKIRLTLSVNQMGVTAVVEDDGRGIDTAAIRDRLRQMRDISPEQVEVPDDQVLDSIFLSQVSTSGSVSDISGRGVGLSSVRSEAGAMGGTVKVSSRSGSGCRFELVIPHPRNDSITRAVIARVGNWNCAVAVDRVVDISSAGETTICLVNGQSTVQFRGKTIPVVSFERATNGYAKENTPIELAGKLLLVMTHEGRWEALIVDAIIDQMDLIVEPVSPLVRHKNAFIGVASIPGNEIAFVLDPSNPVRGIHNVG